MVGRVWEREAYRTSVEDLAEKQRHYFQGELITWLQVINMLAVPNDGYRAVLKRT